jgi:hypothetical protein
VILLGSERNDDGSETPIGVVGQVGPHQRHRIGLVDPVGGPLLIERLLQGISVHPGRGRQPLRDGKFVLIAQGSHDVVEGLRETFGEWDMLFRLHGPGMSVHVEYQLAAHRPAGGRTRVPVAQRLPRRIRGPVVARDHLQHGQIRQIAVRIGLLIDGDQPRRQIAHGCGGRGVVRRCRCMKIEFLRDRPHRRHCDENNQQQGCSQPSGGSARGAYERALHGAALFWVRGDLTRCRVRENKACA